MTQKHKIFKRRKWIDWFCKIQKTIIRCKLQEKMLNKINCLRLGIRLGLVNYFLYIGYYKTTKILQIHLGYIKWKMKK